MFNAANFPGASSATLTAAENLYALVTGRISQYTSDARIGENTGQYAFLGPGMQRARMREWDSFIQDQWRVRPNPTIKHGGPLYGYLSVFTAHNQRPPVPN